MTDAKDDVRTIRLMDGFVEAAARTAFTPFMAGMMSSASLFVVSYVNG
jgi:hypothetical protein